MSDTDEEPPETDDAEGGADGAAEDAADDGTPESGVTDGDGAEAAADEAGTTAETGEDAVDESLLGPTATALVAKVAIEDETLAGDVEDHLVELASERDAAEERAAEAEERASELESKLKRKQADFENYKKRAKRRQREASERATRDIVERLVDVRDDLVRALDADHDDVAGLREGVRMTLKEFDRVLDAEGVTEVAPDPGDEVDPQRHEVMLRVESDQPEGTVADVHRSGFVLDETVVRPAQVTVSEGPADDATSDAEDGSASDAPSAGGDSDGDASSVEADDSEKDASAETGDSETAASDSVGGTPSDADGSEHEASSDGDGETEGEAASESDSDDTTP